MIHDYFQLAKPLIIYISFQMSRSVPQNINTNTLLIENKTSEAELLLPPFLLIPLIYNEITAFYSRIQQKILEDIRIEAPRHGVVLLSLSQMHGQCIIVYLCMHFSRLV